MEETRSKRGTSGGGSTPFGGSMHGDTRTFSEDLVQDLLTSFAAAQLLM